MSFANMLLIKLIVSLDIVFSLLMLVSVLQLHSF